MSSGIQSVSGASVSAGRSTTNKGTSKAPDVTDESLSQKLKAVEASVELLKSTTGKGQKIDSFA